MTVLTVSRVEGEPVNDTSFADRTSQIVLGRTAVHLTDGSIDVDVADWAGADFGPVPQVGDHYRMALIVTKAVGV